jgi:hypothetical protein
MSQSIRKKERKINRGKKRKKEIQVDGKKSELK